jgi:hypothetical protein
MEPSTERVNSWFDFLPRKCSMALSAPVATNESQVAVWQSSPSSRMRSTGRAHSWNCSSLGAFAFGFVLSAAISLTDVSVRQSPRNARTWQ